jgi:hypothetical protein
VGLALVISMLAHTIEITWHFVRGDAQFSGEPWTYDFRTYSLVLLAAVLIAVGLGVLEAASALSRDRIGSAKRGAALSVATLAIVLPLIPIQPLFGLMFSVLAALSLLVLAALRGIKAPV